MNAVTIDPELRDLIPPLAVHERAALEAEIVAAGRATEPLLVWVSDDGSRVLVDGHHRYEICTRLGLPYTIHEARFFSRQAVKQWMLDHQLARRNLTADQVCALAAIRGVDPPAEFRGMLMSKYACELVAAGAASYFAPVLAGKYSVKTAWLRWRERTGQAPPKRARPAPAPAPAPTDDDPLAAVRAARAAGAEASADKKALKAALAQLEQSERSLDVLAQLTAQPLPPRAPLKLDPRKRRVSAVAVFSDAHMGAIFPATLSTFGNACNPAIIENRIKRFFSATAWQIQQRLQWAAFDEIVLTMLGDNTEGQLHEETIETALPALEGLRLLRPILIAGVRQLCELDIPMTIVGAYGNHGRDTQKIRHITGAKHCVDWLLYQDMADALRPDGVRVVATTAEDQYHDTCDHTLHVQHGFSIKYQGGLAGLTAPLNRAVATWDRRRATDVHVIGHWHQLQYGRRWFVNGSIKGYDPYAASKNFAPEEPAQWFFIIDAKRGPTDFVPLWVGDPERERELAPEMYP